MRVFDKGFKNLKCSKSKKQQRKYKIKLAAFLLNMQKSKNWECAVCHISLFSALKMFKILMPNEQVVHKLCLEVLNAPVLLLILILQIPAMHC